MAPKLSFIFCCTNYQTMRLSILKSSFIKKNIEEFKSFLFFPPTFFLATKQADDENKKKFVNGSDHIVH